MENFSIVLGKFDPLIKSIIKKYHLTDSYDEAYQIGAVALWEAYKKFDPAKGAFPAYARVYVKGAILNELSKEKSFTNHIDLMDLQDEQLQTLQQVEKNYLEKEILLSYLQDLTKREQQWIIYTILKGYKTKEIAYECNVSEHTVRSWKKSAVKKLRKKLTLKKL